MNTAELIRNCRRHRSWTQGELAIRLRTSQSAVARWERWIYSPRVDTLERILETCGFRIEIQPADPFEVDRDQLRERLSWSPKERLHYLLDMLAFEERAQRATRAGS